MRTGKIARLPREIRDQLNRRLDDGLEAKSLAAWLNSLPEVQAVLATQFHGQPISEPNLTHWKQGGFLDWQQLETQRHCVRQCAEDAATLDADAASAPVAQHLATILAADLALATRQLLASAADPQERWQRLQQLLPHLAKLRRDDHRAQSVELARRREARRDAQARARQTEASQRADLTAAVEDELISALFASPDPSLKAIAVRLAEHALARRPDPAPGAQAPLSQAASDAPQPPPDPPLSQLS